MNPPPSQLVIRLSQIDAPASSFDSPLTGGSALYRLVDGRMPVCARHLYELGAYLPGAEARPVLSVDQVDSLVVEFGLRREDLMPLHGPQDPLLGEERCRMCESVYAEGNLCSDDGCRRPLHPQWPALYCSCACAAADAV